MTIRSKIVSRAQFHADFYTSGPLYNFFNFTNQLQGLSLNCLFVTKRYETNTQVILEFIGSVEISSYIFFFGSKAGNFLCCHRVSFSYCSFGATILKSQLRSVRNRKQHMPPG